MQYCVVIKVSDLLFLVLKGVDSRGKGNEGLISVARQMSAS